MKLYLLEDYAVTPAGTQHSRTDQNPLASDKTVAHSFAQNGDVEERQRTSLSQRTPHRPLKLPAGPDYFW